MHLSEFYVPTMKDVSSDVVSASHKYSLRAGLVRQTTSGVYTWLPMGLMVLRKLEGIIREEMVAIGFSEVLMPSMQPADLWKESGRYGSYGTEMFNTKDRSGREILFGPTHEEVVTDVVRTSLKSYRDLPINLFQIQWKLRDELRPRHGVMRSREFLMKDGYSFDIDLESAMRSYQAVFGAYHRIFNRLRLPVIAVNADSGAIGGTMSHEFHVLSDTGEGTLYYDVRVLDLYEDNDFSVEKLKNVYTAADDVHDEKKCGVHEKDLRSSKGIEVGHVFCLEERYSRPMKLKFHNDKGSSSYVQMGCYGIGISRLFSAIIEVFHDDAGIKWPECVAPFKMGIVDLSNKDEKCISISEHLHSIFSKDALYDNTNDSPGVKLSRMDLMGMPYQIIIGNSFIKNGVLELKNRETGTIEVLSIEETIRRLNA